MNQIKGSLDISNCEINFPDHTAINDLDNIGTISTTGWSFPVMVTPEVKVLKIKGKILFYYWNDKTLHYVIYEDGKPIEFKPTDDFLQVLNELGVFE